MVDYSLAILSLIIPTMLGFGLMRFYFSTLLVDLSDFEILFLQFGMGFGIITLFMLLFSVIGTSFHHIFISLFCFAIFGFSLSKSAPKKERTCIWHKGESRVNGLIMLLSVAILMNFFEVFIRTMAISIDLWDSWAVWAYKAKVFFIQDSVPLQKFEIFKHAWGNWDYPIHVPLMETWVLLWVGYWNDIMPRIIFPIFFMANTIMVTALLRRYVSPLLALLGTFFVSGLPMFQFCTIGTLAEVVFLFYYFASLMLMLRWYESGRTEFLVLSALLAGFALWSKSESILHLLSSIFFIVMALLRKKTPDKVFKDIGLYFLLMVAVIFPWQLCKEGLHLTNHIFNLQYFVASHWSLYLVRLEHSMAFAKEFLDFKLWNITWVLFCFAVLFHMFTKSKQDINFILLGSIGVQILVIYFLYLTWPFDTYIRDTMPRIMLSPAILSIIYFVIGVGNLRGNQQLLGENS